jgi:DNA-binding response OmpR family regulator
VIDDGTTAATLSIACLRQHGFTVDAVREGLKGLEHALATGDGYRLIVLNVAAPDDGSTPAAVIAAMSDQHFMVLAEDANVPFMVRCLEAGAVDCMWRRDPAELVARVRTQLRRPAPAQSGRFLRVDDLTLDRERQIVHTGPGQAPLSKREFGLLLHLMRRPGCVCTREQILAAVWGTQFDPGTNVVDVYVRRLRHKIGDGRIETHRNAGYLLQARHHAPSVHRSNTRNGSAGSHRPTAHLEPDHRNG